jgi:hypothetical protein
MKQKRKNSSKGVSDLIGTILIIILVIGLAAVIAAFLMPQFLQKSVYIASEVSALTLTPLSGRPVEIIGVLPKAGEPFYIIGQKQPKGGAPVSVRALSPDGRNITPFCIDLTGNLYGKQLYLYPLGNAWSCDMCISDVPPKGSPNPMTNGRWTIQFVDEEAHILVMSNSDGLITKGTTSRPNDGGNIAGNLYRANCSILAPTFTSAPVSPTLGPGNMSYRSFDGTQYMEYPNDPSLSFNAGNLAISLWMRPQGLVDDYTDYGHWETIIGKGIVDPSTTENDNYQLIAVGKKLIFEWDDRNSGRHFQLTTNNNVLDNNLWTYTTLNVENGIPQIYINGIKQDSTIKEGNDPRSTVVVTPPPLVNLKTNDLPMKVGKQNSNTWPFYYKGDIGNLAIYDRALTPAEIQANNQAYTA